MKTQIEAITPENAGLSIVVCSGPRGMVRDNDWPCIEWTVQIIHNRKPVWTGEWSAGVGHVKFPRGNDAYPQGLTQNETYALNTIRMKPSAVLVAKQLWADVAAKLAVAQKVSPSLHSVMGSLMLDGSAFFDGLRFEDWVSEFGYDSDSIKAKEIYEACDKIGRDFARALSRDTISSLREWASNQ